MLDLADVATYLIDRNLISARAVVDGGFRVVDVSRLNRVFVVTAERERGFVLKSAGEAGDAGVAREAAVLERLWSIAESGELALALPTLRSYDSDERVLILGAEPNARDLRRHHARGRFSCTLARGAGRALALLHSIPSTALSGVQQRGDPTSWMRVHEPDLESIHAMSSAAEELTRIIQGSDDLCSALDELVGSWQRGLGDPRGHPLGQPPRRPRSGPEAVDAAPADRLGAQRSGRPGGRHRRILRRVPRAPGCSPFRSSTPRTPVGCSETPDSRCGGCVLP